MCPAHQQLPEARGSPPQCLMGHHSWQSEDPGGSHAQHLLQQTMVSKAPSPTLSGTASVCPTLPAPRRLAAQCSLHPAECSAGHQRPESRSFSALFLIQHWCVDQTLLWWKGSKQDHSSVVAKGPRQNLGPFVRGLPFRQGRFITIKALWSARPLLGINAFPDPHPLWGGASGIAGWPLKQAL